MSKWIRVRFHAALPDYRPVTWPPPGPYWCSGEGDDYSIIVAYVRFMSQVTKYWPEATHIEECGGNGEIVFTDRFPKLDWYTQ